MKELWESWEEGVDLYNCNVPLGFRGSDGNPVQPQTLRTTVDPISYASLYSEPSNRLRSCSAPCTQLALHSFWIPPAAPAAVNPHQFATLFSSCLQEQALRPEFCLGHSCHLSWA